MDLWIRLIFASTRSTLVVMRFCGAVDAVDAFSKDIFYTSHLSLLLFFLPASNVRTKIMFKICVHMSTLSTKLAVMRKKAVDAYFTPCPQLPQKIRAVVHKTSYDAIYCEKKMWTGRPQLK